MLDGEQQTPVRPSVERYRKTTRREQFLQEMNRAVPWQELVRLVEPIYLKGRRPNDSVTPVIWMLKLYFLQFWFSLSASQAEELLHDSYAVRKFLGVDSSRDRLPDEGAIHRFRRLIEKHKLGTKMLKMVDTHLLAHGIRVQMGRIVDATVELPTFTEE